MFKVDPDGKITVSLGGVCTLKCKHCYTLTKEFKHAATKKVEEVVQGVARVEQQFSLICVSGDTDPLLDPEMGIDLIEALSSRFVNKDIMFTTRLVPSDRDVARIDALVSASIARRQLIFPCISVVSLKYPNGIEYPELVPEGSRRVQWLNHLATTGAPAILALRPTFPFALIGRKQIEEIASEVSPKIAAALGEVFLLDANDQIEARLNSPIRSDQDQIGKLTFLDQPGMWSKAYLEAETDFHRKTYGNLGIPYFLRSMSAVSLVRRKWRPDGRAYENLTPDDLKEERSIYP